MSLLKSFPRTFWVANAIELFERWAWYGFFMLFANYLTGSSDAGGLEFSQSQKGILMGVGTGILYFLPVLTGAIADRYGYRKVLCIAFLVYASAFILLPQATTFVGVFLLYIYLALGAALFKPIISATVAKTTNDSNASIGFGLFYMMVNIGAFFGPLVTLLFKGSLRISSHHFTQLHPVAVLSGAPSGRTETERTPVRYLPDHLRQHGQHLQGSEVFGLLADHCRLLDHVSPTLLHLAGLHLPMGRYQQRV